MDSISLGALVSAVKALGIPAVLLVLYVWDNYQRKKRDEDQEEALTKRLRSLEDKRYAKLEDIVVTVTKALQEHAEASREMIANNREQVQVLKQLMIVMRSRKCIADAIGAVDDTRIQQSVP